MTDTCRPALDHLLSAIENEHFTAADLEELCGKYPSCTEQLMETYQMWSELEAVSVPEPTTDMRAGFYRMLQEFEAESVPPGTTRLTTWRARLTDVSPVFRWALVMLIFGTGVATGLFLEPASQSSDYTQQTDGSIQNNYVALTNHNSAIERLKGVQLIKNIEHPNDNIINALNQVLLKDPNVNVRLSAIEAMLHFSENPRARESLIRAIPYQTSSLIQMTLSEVMLELEEERSVEALRKLLESDQVEVEVKMQVEETLEVLL